MANRDPAQPPRRRWDIDTLLARVDLESLLDDLAEPATTARPRRWHCPVPGHDDHHASVSTHTDPRGHQRWRCWSGDETHRGDAIDLVAITQGLTPRDAITWLAERAGLQPDTRPQPSAPQRRPPAPAPTIVPLAAAVHDYVNACAEHLWTPAGQPIRAWLTDTRGFSTDILRTNRVGADPGPRHLPRPRGLPRGTSPAVTFPALDPNGAVRYVQTRYLDPDDGHKYDNPASRLGTNPRLAWTLTTEPSQPGLLVVCEGIPDALTAAQHGYVSVGVLGAQAPDLRVAVHLAQRATTEHRHLVAIIDHDAAGHTWGRRLAELLAEHDQRPTVIQPPTPGMDLNTWALADSTWTSHLADAVASLGHDATPTALHPGPAVDPLDVLAQP